MKPEDFDALVEYRLEICRKTLQTKAGEYATEDRLHNFKVAGDLQGVEPETALLGMWAKHIVSIVDIVNAIEDHGIAAAPAHRVNEKLTDCINYCLLLDALIQERRARVEEEMRE